ncbi:hypothetical protein P9869_10445 [Streptomyces ossamyceticus]|nr:hypothetical protein [Streptomyces ossamyceticus]
MTTGAAAADSAKAVEQPKDDTEQQEESPQAPEQRQKAWEARQDLVRHTARAFASTLIDGDQFGQTGGHHYGDTIFNFGGGGPTAAPRPRSGPVSRTEIAELAVVFRGGAPFDEALARLRSDRIVILSGGQATGRRSAAVMLLSRLGVEQLRELEPPGSPLALRDELDQPVGYVLCDWTARRRHPLRTPHLSGLREQLERVSGHLVITVESSALPTDVPYVRWEPPPTSDVLHSHVTRALGEAPWPELSGLPYVKEFLQREHPPHETAQFAQRLVALHRGEIDEQALAAHGAAAAEAQIERWLTGETPKLLDKAFLVSLAVFDGAPYAVAAELGDGLFKLLHRTENPDEPARIPVFGSSRAERLRLARAEGQWETEPGESILVSHFVARFQDEQIARLLLRELWNLHPSARPSLVSWIQQLAKDGRALVRTRAAGAAALLAQAELASAMAHLIEPWADSTSRNAWLTAANALTLAVLLEVPRVPAILHDWCTGESTSRRWTAVRAYGLLGHAHHEATLRALLDAVRRPLDGDDEQEDVQQLADALELLLLTVKGPVLAALAEYLPPHPDRAVRDRALLAFVQACDRYEEDGGRPIVLDWYSLSVRDRDSADARHLAAFWEAALGDHELTAQALRTLRSWILTAGRDRQSEVALALLLPALTGTPANEQRVAHLLRTLRDSDEDTTGVAARLLTTVA